MTSRQRNVQSACPVCGASLPHTTPMAREYHEQVVHRSTNSDGSEEYGSISYKGRTIQVKRVGPHTWEERNV